VVLHYYYGDKFKQGGITHSFCKSLSHDEQLQITFKPICSVWLGNNMCQ